MFTKRGKAALVAASVPMVAVCIAAQPATAQLSAPPPQIQSYAGDPGRLGDPASWRTAEFLRDNGMLSVGAEFAYAAGYSGSGMNIGIVDSGVFAGHMREHGSLDTNYTVGDRYFSVEAQGGDTGPTPGFYDPAFNDSHGTHVSGTVGASRDGVGETHALRTRSQHARRRVQQRHLPGQHAQDRRRVLRPPAGYRDPGADAGQRLPRQRLPSRERRANGGRQADQDHHQQLGQPAPHGELQHLRSAARRPGELRPERRMAAPVHARRRRRRERQDRPLAQRRHRGRAHRHDHPVHRRQRRLREPDGAGRGAVLPARPGGPLLHDVRDQPRDRAHVQSRRLGPRSRAAGVQPVRRREVVMRDRAEQDDQQHLGGRRRRRAAAQLQGRVGHVDGRARTRRPCWRSS